jgi:hydroxymethylbilane synthase
VRIKITVGSRGSKLALIQAEAVIATMKKKYPGLEIKLSKIVTSGDRDLRTPLDRMGTAVFVKELEKALRDGRIDLAVHSLKDMPADTAPGLALLAVPERLDSRDALVAWAKLADLPGGARIGTGSLRRALQLKKYRPDLETVPIRGNIETRLRKVASGDVDGVIVAAAAMLRLGREKEITEYLPLESFLPAAGQGALAVEGRLDDDEIAKIASPLNSLPAWQGVTAERAFLRAMGGGCRAPIAALGTVNGDVLRLEGMVADANGMKMLQASEEGNAASPEQTGERLASRLLALGAAEFIARAGTG